MEDNRTRHERHIDQVADVQLSAKLLDYASSAYERQVSNFDRLDSKAATLAGFIGVILAISLGPLGQDWVTQAFKRSDGLALSFKLLVVLTASLLAVALLFALLVLSVRETAQPLTAKQAIDIYKTPERPSMREQGMLKQLIRGFSLAEEHRLKINHRKARALQATARWAIAATVVGIIAFVIQTLAQSLQ